MAISLARIGPSGIDSLPTTHPVPKENFRPSGDLHVHGLVDLPLRPEYLEVFARQDLLPPGFGRRWGWYRLNADRSRWYLRTDPRFRIRRILRVGQAR